MINTPYPEKTNMPYWRYRRWIFWKISNVVPTPRNPNTPYPTHWIRRTLLDPFQFSYPKRRLTMEEIVNKFIEEGKREHEEMDAFIREFRTTNELLLKERNNSLSELEFEVYGLSRAINKDQMVGCEAKGVTTRGGKSTTKPIGDNTNTIKHPLPHHDEPTTPDEIPTKIKPKKNQEQTNELQSSSIPFPHRLRKEKEEAQQRNS
ncbi:hypothetical protein Tco_0549447 [Tanacetum coccineum]